MNAIRAIYENGTLRLLDPVDLREGQQVEIVLRPKTEDELVREALKDLDIQWPNPNAITDTENVDDKTLEKEIAEGFKDAPSLSELIIQERYEDG
ncbi:MAG: antitoxin family protein [Anaerolineae bacterium]